jgi:hypothetical protein
MIPVPTHTVSNGPVRVWLATGHTDMRNYAERIVMRSPQPVDPRATPFSTTWSPGPAS